MRARLLLLVSLAALAACAGSSRPASGGGGDAGGDPARLYRSKCAACHRAYEPEGRTAAAWADVVARMAPRAHLRDEERAALLGWLQAHAKDATPTAKEPSR